MRSKRESVENLFVDGYTLEIRERCSPSTCVYYYVIATGDVEGMFIIVYLRRLPHPSMGVSKEDLWKLVDQEAEAEHA